MHFSIISSKLSWLLLLSLIIYFEFLYLSHKELFVVREVWDYYVDMREFSYGYEQSQHCDLELKHDGEGQYEPIQLKITTKNNQLKTFSVDDLNHTHIDEKILIQKHQIKHAIIRSNHPMNFKKNEKIRLLQDITEKEDFVLVCIKFFSVFLPLIRNLLILGIFLNETDFFLPLILTTESILMLGFLNSDKHYLAELFKLAINSKVDVLNLIRRKIFGVFPNENIDGNQLLMQYGFTKNLLQNLSGELTIAAGFIAVSVIIKIGGAMLKLQKWRLIGSKSRGILNGILFCIMPRVLTFSSFSIRQISLDSFGSALYPAIGIAFITGYAIFLISLWLQIRNINQKAQYLEESRNSIGLVTRIHYKGKFQLDCLKCSNLYYPVINFIRLLVFFIPIGIFFDFEYASFGGIIASQMIYVMLTVSSSGFTKSRDSVVYPLCDFLLLIIQLTHIAIGWAQNVHHTEITIIHEKVFFCILLAIYFLLIGSLCADISTRITENCMKNEDDNEKNEENTLLTNKCKKTRMEKLFQSQKQTKFVSKITCQTLKQYSNSIGEVFQDDDQSQCSFPFNYPIVKPSIKQKIRKIRKGQVI